MLKLRYQTPEDWTKAVLADFDQFLLDHAGAEKKAHGMAISMISHYPDRPEIVSAMMDLAIEELSHFREVSRLIYQRGLQLGADNKDHYVGSLRNLMRKGSEQYLLDRLLIAGIIEARGAERFGLIANALPEGTLKKFYQSITKSEDRHHELFIELAQHYFSLEDIQTRLDQLLNEEALIISQQPLQATLH